MRGLGDTLEGHLLRRYLLGSQALSRSSSCSGPTWIECDSRLAPTWKDRSLTALETVRRYLL